MEYVWYSFAGIIGGVLGGMGMGGGTLLIPLLGIFYGVAQKSAQAVNLISFIPMAVIALCIHIKNGLVSFKDVLIIVLPGIVACICGAFMAKGINGELLKRIFGGFLIALSVYQFLSGIKLPKDEK